MSIQEKKNKKEKKSKKERKTKHSSKRDERSSSSSSDSSSSDSDDSNVRRSVITGKRIKMQRDMSTQDRMLEIEREAKRHFMNSQY